MREPAPAGRDRARLRAAVLGVLAVVVLGAAATAVANPVDTADRDGGGEERGVVRNLSDWGVSLPFDADGLTRPNETANESAGGERGEQPADTGPLPRPSGGSLVLVAVGLVLVVAVVALLRADRGDDADEQERTDRGGEPDDEAAAVGRAAGEAVGRIEADPAADPDNEVYRAWAEMTAALSVDRPRSSTPGEFRRAAVEAGIDEDDARELTRLFEEVRYGDRPATATRERRATAVLERIESAYGGDVR